MGPPPHLRKGMPDALLDTQAAAGTTEEIERERVYTADIRIKARRSKTLLSQVGCFIDLHDRHRNKVAPLQDPPPAEAGPKRAHTHSGRSLVTRLKWIRVLPRSARENCILGS